MLQDVPSSNSAFTSYADALWWGVVSFIFYSLSDTVSNYCIHSLSIVDHDDYHWIRWRCPSDVVGKDRRVLFLHLCHLILRPACCEFIQTEWWNIWSKIIKWLNEEVVDRDWSWIILQGILGSGFALKVQQKQRQKHFNRLEFTLGWRI